MSRKPPATETHDKERIAKVMARAGLCSRRDAETWIVAGRVSVNGQRLASPAFTVSPSDRIEVDGKPLPGRERTRLFLYHKPRGLVTTNRDERGRPTIFGALPKHLPRLVSIGRLDINSEGLLLLTNDGGLARVLELPDTGWLRRYRVRANGRVTQEMLDRLSRGIKVDGIKYGPILATLDREQGSNVWLTLGLREGKNREVRNVLRELGLSVNRLIRVSYGPFQLGELAPASVEEVKMRVLREQLGGKVERLAGADFSAPLREPEDEAPQKPPRTAAAPSHLKSGLSDSRPSKAKPGSAGFRSSKKNMGKSEFGKTSRSSSSSPPARGRWKSKRNVARGRGPQR
jgi:23S rRNA pseudouridine2605 synthase